MKEELLKLNEQINLCKNQADFDKVILEWKIANDEIDSWIDTIWSSLDEFDLEKLPFVLEALYKQNDKIKFMFFCMILEATHEKLPFLTNIEKIPMFKAKYEMLVPTIANVTVKSYNGIADALYLVLLKTDPKGKYIKDNDKNNIIEGINNKLQLLKAFIEKNEEIPEEVYYALEIILDVSCYYNNEETINILKEMECLNLNNITKVFLIKTYAENNIEVKKEFIDEIVSVDRYAYELLRVLEQIAKTDLLKNTSLKQEDIARAKMIEWLEYPTELGDSLEKIEFVDTYEKDGYVYYIYKFTSNSDTLSRIWLYAWFSWWF